MTFDDVDQAKRPGDKLVISRYFDLILQFAQSSKTPPTCSIITGGPQRGADSTADDSGSPSPRPGWETQWSSSVHTTASYLYPSIFAPPKAV
ncbi:hypothetical protein NHX12_029839 [Muraenolepis orangiensis]|uniref:Uncharacterized protein n=1 Tax=Muraenolepis orangiensis TaxID=630683 RepID=A0A9Q0IKG2_9TELE|nr:hypothetical protein NHX12_029839 [Muraenolepis orangiensis]